MTPTTVFSIPVIAINGPSASGKGTVAQLVAQAQGFHYLDSGALYRLLALAAERRSVSFGDEEGLARLAEGLDIRFEGSEVWLDGESVGDAIRTEDCGNGASRIAAYPRVRAALLDLQQIKGVSIAIVSGCSHGNGETSGSASNISLEQFEFSSVGSNCKIRADAANVELQVGGEFQPGPVGGE